MIRDAQLSQLRPLVRMLESVDPALTLMSHAPELLDVDQGSLVLLIVREEELGWLNLNRPIFAQRSLRVVLWVDPRLSGRLKFESPDLHDWISHFVPCPEGVPVFAVEGLRIGSSWWPGVAWRGPGLQLALAHLKLEVTMLQPDSEFGSLVATLAADRRSNVCWVGVDSLRGLWRVRWALAEARHHGFCVLEKPSVSTPGWFPVSSLQLVEDDALSFIEGENPLRRAIELEFEREQSLFNLGSMADEAEVGLLLRSGPLLRQRHSSPEIGKWRRELVRAIRRAPERAWSRAEIAVFASLERDRQHWPDWHGEPKYRHSTEHLLRVGRRNLDLSALSAALLGDHELVSRWGSNQEVIQDMIHTAQRLSSSMWEKTNIFDPKEVPDVETPFLIGADYGWDIPLAARVTSLAAEQLLDRPEELGSFISKTLEAARADLGAKDRSLLPLIQIASVATALAGDPWGAKNWLEDVAAEWLGPFVFGPDYAAVCTLCGDYTQAIIVLQGWAHGDSPETQLYIAVLLAAGQPDRARSELERILTEPRDPSDYLGDSTIANERANSFLRARLRSLSHPDPHPT